MENYKKFAVDFAQRAGKIMLKHFTLGVKKQLKADNSPVTEADLEINHLLIEEVKNNFPDHGILGEEESHLHTAGSEYVWVCDPIDGTIVFARGIPIATTSLALTRNGKSILGVVYDPFCDRLYVGEEGRGATINGRPIHVSETATLSGSEGSLEISANSKFNVLDLPKLFKAREKTNVVILNSIVYSATMLAVGGFDFVIFPRMGAHDVAAIKIIVEEAGGKVTDLFGNDQRYDRETKGVLATNGKLHNQLLELLRETMDFKKI